MDLRELPLDDLVLDPNLNLRDHLDSDTVERYADAWNRLPPIIVYDVDGRFVIADGFHRHAAAVLLKRRTIPAEVRGGTFTEALDFVAGANLFHGLPLTRAERRRAIEVKLKLHHERSDRHLAEELSVGRELIAKIRRQMIEGGQIPAGTTRVGADGKTYPAASQPKDPNEHLPRKGELSGQDDPRDRGGREADAAPWDDTRDPLPPAAKDGSRFAGSTPPWEEADPKAVALAAPSPASAPTIEEMLGLMTRQILEVVSWTQAEGFVDAYRSAGTTGRDHFQNAAVKLAVRADQLRKL